MNNDLVGVIGSICSIISLLLAGAAHLRIGRIQSTISGRDSKRDINQVLVGTNNNQSAGDMSWRSHQ